MASAKPNFLTSFNQHYETAGTRLDSCPTCHNGEAVNPYGRAYLGSGRNFAAIENLDSDGDRFTNLVEIKALNFPGNPDDHPQITSGIVPETPINVTEPSDNVTPEQSTTEMPVSNTTEEQKSPGFAAIPMVVGLLAVVCLKRRYVRK
ncbi:hypothetical protein [Methanosarcina sp. WWM596]|uniref:hypothetical protein n=1 Tax=Methanosarcina sp. WWM596 TaxID=1434103 RepID=UPI00064F6CFA|nr:hypothetical protein [Methanosarcina sp. WWM596]